MRDEIDLDEISNHVRNLQNKDRKEDNIISELNFQEDINSELKEWKEVSKDEIFESSENISTIRDVNLDTRKCDICKKTINLEKNLSGLVLHNSHFLCEECCQDSSKAELDVWMNTKMANPGDLKPVALWLMKEKNKTRLF